jgi:hypothetical protein
MTALQSHIGNKMNKHPKLKPKWYLSADYGIGIDALNWRLYQTVQAKKVAAELNWKVIGYFPTLGLLVKGLQEHILREDISCPDLETHVNTALECWEACAQALKDQLDAMAVGIDTYPPKYATYKILDKK